MKSPTRVKTTVLKKILDEREKSSFLVTTSCLLFVCGEIKGSQTMWSIGLAENKEQKLTMQQNHRPQLFVIFTSHYNCSSSLTSWVSLNSY